MSPEQQIPKNIAKMGADLSETARDSLHGTDMIEYTSDNGAEITVGIREQIKSLKDDIASLKQVLFDSGRDENGNRTDSATTPPEILALLQDIREKEEQLEKLEYGVNHE